MHVGVIIFAVGGVDERWYEGEQAREGGSEKMHVGDSVDAGLDDQAVWVERKMEFGWGQLEWLYSSEMGERDFSTCPRGSQSVSTIGVRLKLLQCKCFKMDKLRHGVLQASVSRRSSVLCSNTCRILKRIPCLIKYTKWDRHPTQ